MRHEGKTYICCWERNDDGYRLWLKRWPKVSCKGKSFVDAYDAVHSEIVKLFEDMEPNLDFDGPAPWDLDRPEFRKPPLVTIKGQVSVFHGPEDKAFDGGLCPLCHCGVGNRSGVSLWFKGIDPPLDAGTFGTCANRPFVSDRFIELLSPGERSGFEFRPIQTPPGAKYRYFEPLAKPLAKLVVGKDFASVGQWYCPVCKSAMMCYDPFKSSSPFARFICRDDLPNVLPSFFLIESAGFIEMCMTSKKWFSIKGKVGTRGIGAGVLGVIGKEQVNWSPEIAAYADPGPDGKYVFYDFPIEPTPDWYR